MERIPKIERLKTIRLVAEMYYENKPSFKFYEGKEVYYSSDLLTAERDSSKMVSDVYKNLIGNNDINIGDKYYCFKGHNITKESSNLLKEKGYHKTIKLDNADKVVTNSKSLQSIVRTGYNSFVGTFEDVLDIVDRIYEAYLNYHNNSTSKATKEELQLANEIITTIRTVLNSYSSDENRYMFDISNLLPYYRSSQQSLIDFKRDIIPWEKLRNTYFEVSEKFDFDFIINNQDKIIDQQVLLAKISADKITMDYDLYKQIDSMLSSSDNSNRMIANRLLVSCDPSSSFAYLCILFYVYQSHFYVSRDDFRDANSKSFMSQLCAESNKIVIQTGTPSFWSINYLYDTIKGHQTHTKEIDDILLDVIKVEILNSISHQHKELINTVALKDSIVLA